jgi:hypothetical protein
MDGERGTKNFHQISLDEELGLNKIHQEPVTRLGADAYDCSQIKI